MTKEEAKSCICTIKMLQKLAYNIHGVMDVVDADNCKKIIKALEQQTCEDYISREKANKLKEAIKSISDNPLFNMISGDTILEIVLEIIDRFAESEG